uniref:Putative secreted protein n=1 Tax=Mycobacterium sp. (strain JLS) TaxID=164757 RepID=A0A5Q5CA10_MYCSJ
MKAVVRLAASCVTAALLVAGCGSDDKAADETAPAQTGWVDDEVTFTADGLTIHGTYRHRDGSGPATLLISESGQTDRNGDNAVAGPVGNMRQLAELLSERDVASLRYDKVGTGRTGLGPYATRPADVGTAVYTTGAAAALRFLADQPDTARDRISVYALGEGTVHAMSLAAANDPAVHSLALLQPLAARYLDIITGRVRAEADPTVLANWLAAVEEIRTKGTVPAQLPEGLGAIVNPGNIKAVIEADRVDPLALAAKVPAGTPVLLTCSNSDGQAKCDALRPLMDALRHTELTVVELDGVNHVLRDDPTDNVANYAQQTPLSPQVVKALDEFVGEQP